jgi:hypothetical protein
VEIGLGRWVMGCGICGLKNWNGFYVGEKLEQKF